MNKYIASVVIPVYNQFSSLEVVIQAFSKQTILKDQYELIVVDDGSTDELRNRKEEYYKRKYDINIKLIKQKNGGRAIARNCGIRNCESDIIIFCDGDRFPNSEFISEHLKAHKEGKQIVIGESYDYFGRKLFTGDNEFNWLDIHRFSKLPGYFKRITSIYDDQGSSSSKLVWLSLLIGNSSIERQILEKVGLFDVSFNEWGFEHFELGVRMYKAGYSFYFNHMCKNYHIPHSRESGFYESMILKNSKKLAEMYPEINGEVVTGLLTGKIDVLEAESSIYV